MTADSSLVQFACLDGEGGVCGECESCNPPKKCAVCGSLIEGEAQELRGIYGRGWRHVDVMVCYAACNFQAGDDDE